MDNDYYDFIDHSFDIKPKRHRTLTDQEILQREKLKLVKNRESAKNSRKRKTIYVNILEGKVEALTKQLAQFQQLQSKSDEFLKQVQLKCFLKQEKLQRKAVVNHHCRELFQQAIPPFAQLLMTQEPHKEKLQESLGQFKQCFEEINQIKDKALCEMDNYKSTLQELQQLDERSYLQFNNTIERMDQKGEFKEALNEMEEDLHSMCRESDYQIEVASTYEVYTKLLQFIHKQRIN